MNKQEILHQLENAKRMHISWRIHALNLVSGLSAIEKAPLGHDECEFNRWLKEEGLKYCGHFDSYHQLDTVHQDVHKAYQAIWNSVQDNQHSKTLQNMDRLTDISDRLILGLEQLADDIKGH